MRKHGTGLVSATVTDYLVKLIHDGKIRPGELIPSEHDLMRRLSVGRSSVREAIRGLAMMGIVEAKRRRGTIVVSPISNEFREKIDRSITYWAVKDLFEVREVLEGHAAAAAAKMANADDIKRVENAALTVERKVRVGSVHFSDNTDFHLSIARASHNPILVYCLKSLIGSFQDVRMQFNERLLDMPDRDIEEHRKIVKAIKARDPLRARKHMQAHIRSYISQIGIPSGARRR